MTAEPHSPLSRIWSNSATGRTGPHWRICAGFEAASRAKPEMYPYVVPWLPNDPWADSRYF